MARRPIPVIVSGIVLVVVMSISVACRGTDEAASPTATEVPTATTASPIPTPTPLPTPTRVPTPSPVDCASGVPARAALAQLVMTLAAPDELPSVIAAAEAGAVGSVALLGSPSSADLAGLQAIDATAAVPFLVASDEEGGRVQRLASLLGVVPAAADLAARTPEEIADIFRTYGSKLASVGVDVAFAPVVDVGGGPGIGSRAFSDDPAVVTADAGAVIDGYVAAGITPVIKHFPGHGSASGDTHLGFATTPPIDVLRTRDLLPFAELVDREVWVMVGHLLVPGLTEDLPASLSPAAIDGLLRGELGFDGVVVTDALGMGAVAQRWTNPEAALLALLAGADIVMVESPAVVPAVLDHLAAALDDGTLPRGTIDDSLVRVLAAKGVEPCDGSRRLGSPP